MDDHTTESSWTQGFFLGMLVGAAGGAALALLYAPSPGEDVRRYLGDRAREGRERAATVVDRGREMLDGGREAFEQGREMLSTAIAEGRDAYREARGRERV
jgi:gas vesicle protein